MKAKTRAGRRESAGAPAVARPRDCRVWWIGAGLVAVLLAATAGPARAQLTNQITQVEPNSAAQGTADLLVTFTLDGDLPQVPPAGDLPLSVKIGDLDGSAVTHASNFVVTARFTIPTGEPTGTKTASITFAIPGGTLVFSLAGAFSVTAGAGDEYTIERTLADGAQRNTIAFDGLGFLTGSLGSQSFLPPGKVADFSGFQYLRDNDPTELGHNTDFVTIVAFNMLHLLTADQVAQLVARAESQVGLINEFAYMRFPLLDAFRRPLEGDEPPGSPGLDEAAVKAYTAQLYRLDGQISYDRARLLGGIVRSLSAQQRAALDSLKALNGVGNWDRTLADPLQSLHLEHDVNVAVMTYASEMYSWYAGSVEADVYFCPERQGTYFGSFYLKDWPAMGNPDYTIDEQLTARAGEEFLAILADSQSVVTDLVDLQREALYEIVARRQDISELLRGFLTSASIDSAAVLALSARYGELDGEIGYLYATRFARASRGLTAGQRAQLLALADSLGYLPPAGAFLYSAPITMPTIADTDFLFTGSVTGVGEAAGAHGLALRSVPNPASGNAAISFALPAAGPVRVTVLDVRGRKVRLLADGPLAGGPHRLSWDARDDAGRVLPAGAYFVKLETAVGTRSVKVILAW